MADPAPTSLRGSEIDDNAIYAQVLDHTVNFMVKDEPSPDRKVAGKKLEYAMEIIARHETGSDEGYLDPTTKQISQHWGSDEGWDNLYPESERFYVGPGRGLFQYEVGPYPGAPKASNSAEVAMNRFTRIMGGVEELPSWARKYYDEDGDIAGVIDFSELTAQQQQILFMADKSEDKNVAMRELYNIMMPGNGEDSGGKFKLSEWWSKYHHKGDHSATGAFDTREEIYNNNRRR